jgi:hypothetical protein
VSSSRERDAPNRLRLAVIIGVALAAAVFGVASARADVALAAGGVALVAGGLVAGGIEMFRYLARGEAHEAKKRPPFAQRYPKTPELNRLLTAFRDGNWAYVRREAPVLAANTQDEEVRHAARDLERRIEPDPTAVYLLGVGLALLTVT